ncbi:E3 ubiquitin ligase BIG BROTHER [Acorus calamus]|uniref:E3 ubiquitin ligase BIG BROTHER n=1 Tax=Acorus calamus TaxID=4465 RepID=A0AAV9C0V3_ACOCL|nr:E3 ubiquitin ligase BIG BROTHER [Acorus calamus]
MNGGNRQVEVHYINTGFPYTVTESFMDLFEGLSYVHADVSLTEALHDQESTYWSMNNNFYKYGLSGLVSTYFSHGHAYEVNYHVPRLDGSRRERVWDNHLLVNIEENPSPTIDVGVSGDEEGQSNTEECIRTHNSASPQVQRTHNSAISQVQRTHNSAIPQVIWQDNIDPDNMTYEELLDLGEAVGTQSRGLSQERISLLPISKYKSSFFSRKKARGERCVICQMEYKRGDRQMTLPCKHVYHASCVTRWLSINKACPVCYTEVFGEESNH